MSRAKTHTSLLIHCLSTVKPEMSTENYVKFFIVKQNVFWIYLPFMSEKGFRSLWCIKIKCTDIRELRNCLCMHMYNYLSWTEKKKAGQNTESYIMINFQLNRKQQVILWNLLFTSLSLILIQYSDTHENTVCIHLTNISITKDILHHCKVIAFSVIILLLSSCYNG